MEHFKTLYKKAKTGAVLVYTLSYELKTTESKIYRDKGQEGGKMTRDVTLISSGKNLGKANETSIESQMYLQLDSMVNSLLDHGYKLEYPTQDSTNTDASGKVKPMLAQAYNPAKPPKATWAYIQPKLDGVRALSEYDTELEIRSRKGKPYPVAATHLFLDLVSMFINMDKGIVLDGELYIHGMDFEQMISAIKKEGPDSHKIEYVIYDCVMPGGYKTRHDFLQKMIVEHSGLAVSKCKTHYIELTPENLKKWHDHYVTLGYEGIMIRLPEGKYEDGHRSSGLLKYKEFETAEFEIVDVLEGSGRDEKSAVFVCKTKSGDVFNVKPEGSLEKRQEYFQNREACIGEMLTVKYQNLTKYGIPRFPVGITIRDYE